MPVGRKSDIFVYKCPVDSEYLLSTLNGSFDFRLERKEFHSSSLWFSSRILTILIWRLYLCFVSGFLIYCQACLRLIFLLISFRMLKGSWCWFGCFRMIFVFDVRHLLIMELKFSIEFSRSVVFKIIGFGLVIVKWRSTAIFFPIYDFLVFGQDNFESLCKFIIIGLWSDNRLLGFSRSNWRSKFFVIVLSRTSVL